MRLIRTILFSTVFLTGMAVLILEVAAVRLLTPYFGSSLYVLSSVLTIILLALSVGYYLGGKCADRLPYHVPLYTIITSGGLVLLFLLLVSDVLLPELAPHAPLLIGPLFFSAILFFTPAFLLGIDSPYVITILSRITEEAHRGEIVGKTFFWSTAGSITGSLSSGFFLIPNFGLRETLTGTGVLLVLLGIGGATILTHTWKRRNDYDTRNNKQLTVPMLVAALLALAMAYQLTNTTVSAASLYESDGYYSHIRIFDGTYYDQPVRYMKRDINNSSAIFSDSNELVYAYTQFAPLYQDLVPDAGNFLMLGGGAYTIPAAIHRLDEDISIDVVELEPVLFELAQEFFRLPESDRITNHIVDARVFLARGEEQYDVMFLDAFSSGHFVPPHLVTQEFFDTLAGRLTDDGVLIINFIASTPTNASSSLLGSFTKTLQTVFQHNEMFVTFPLRPDVPQNVMFIVSKNPDTPLLNDDTIIIQGDFTYRLAELRRDPSDYIGPEDVVFTDNFSPVEVLLLKERFRF